MKFRYIGLKEDGERAFMDKTGIEWMPGSEHEVNDPSVAADMQRHPTIWERIDGAPIALASARQPAVNTSATVNDQEVDDDADAAEKARLATMEPLHTIKVEEGDLVLDGMEAPELHALAKKLGVKVHHAAGAAKVRDALVASQKTSKAKK